MKKIIVIGNSIAGVRALEEIRVLDRESEIAVFCEDNHLPYQSCLFGDFLSKTITEDKVFYKPNEFYKTQNIQMILGKKISRVDFKKNKVITLEKEQHPYDMLLITDTVSYRFPEIKGTNKMGVFGLRSLGDIKDILAVAHLVDTVVVEADSLSGIRMAQGLKKRGKEVVYVFSSAYPLSGILDQEAAGLIAKCLEENGIRLMKENALSEILGDGEVKAVRFKTGKVLASQMAVMGNAKMDLKIFAESPLEINHGILVDRHLRSNIENVFAVDGACELREPHVPELDESHPLLLEEQGSVVGLNICGHWTPYAPGPRIVGLNLFNLSIALIGKTKRQEGLREQTRFDAPSSSYKKIFIEENRIVGAVLINSPALQSKIVSLIKEKTDITAFEEHILDENFGHEQPVKSNGHGEVSQAAAVDVETEADTAKPSFHIPDTL